LSIAFPRIIVHESAEIGNLEWTNCVYVRYIAFTTTGMCVKVPIQEDEMGDSWMVMVAGPYRSGTGGDPKKMQENLDALGRAALEVWNRGHLPVIGEWIALPLAKAAGSKQIGDPVWDRIGYPAADRLIDRCDAVLRLPGASKGADGDVDRARALGLPIVTAVDELPAGTPLPGRPA